MTRKIPANPTLSSAAAARFLHKHAENPRRRPIPLYGLVLAGDRTPGAADERHASAARAFRLLKMLCARVYLSTHDHQGRPFAQQGMPSIKGRSSRLGHTGFILSAQTRHPTAAWFVVEGGAPCVEIDNLRYLARRRSRKSIATAFISPNDHLPVALCAIYEPSSRAVLRRYVRQGVSCPRKMLLLSRVHLVHPRGTHTTG